MCLYPKFIINKKYTATKKNNGNIPILKDFRTKYVPVGCGNCMECKKQKARGWQVRLMEEIRINNTGKFVTFSFSDESLIHLETELNSNLAGYNLENKIATLAVRRFLERWRKQYKKSLRHWLVTELGQNNTERIHLHGILFTNETLETVRKTWKYGNINKWDKDWKNNYVTERTINYIVKYINKSDEIHKYYNPIILTSPGLGRNYINRPDSKLNKFNNDKTNEMYKTRSGIKLPLPIYYRNKLYTDDQKEQL